MPCAGGIWGLHGKPAASMGQGNKQAGMQYLWHCWGLQHRAAVLGLDSAAGRPECARLGVPTTATYYC